VGKRKRMESKYKANGESVNEETDKEKVELVN
jgi:hypothetical protein